MAGGQRIDDHGSWVGSKGNNSVFPDGPHKVRDTRSVEGVGSVMNYEDTDSAIKHQQSENKSQTLKKPMKSGYRN